MREAGTKYQGTESSPPVNKEGKYLTEALSVLESIEKVREEHKRLLSKPSRNV